MNKLIFVFAAGIGSFINAVSPQLNMMPVKSIKHHMSLDKNFLTNVATKSRAEVLVETGTAKGETTNIAKDIFKEIHTIEVDKKLADECKKRFKAYKRVTVHEGDSAQVLPTILPSIAKKKIVFWLDGHNSPNMKQGEVNTPLLHELALIKEAGIRNAVLLIDDIRCAIWQSLNWCMLVHMHGSSIRELYDDVGYGWPSFHQVLKAIKEINKDYEIGLLGDILIACPASMRLSPFLKACLVSAQSFDEKISQQELVNAEKIIAAADNQALKGLKEQIEIMSKYEHACYHAHLRYWYGLILLKKRNYKSAYDQFMLAQSGGLKAHHLNMYVAEAKSNL